MTLPDLLHKDVAPALTIERARTSLERAGFARSDGVAYKKAFEGCHSCQVRFRNYPALFANGKGLTQELALASALAEFLERLQCLIDVRFSRAGEILSFPPVLPRHERRAAQIADAAPELAASELALLRARPDEVVECVPFIDMGSGETVELPLDWLYALTGSNGMCAGNSPEEALVHGLCEVFERHALHSLERGAVTGLPSVSAAAFGPLRPPVAGLLAEMEAAGVEVIVKDATLDGRFPVIAVVLHDRERGAYQVAFGSDPVYDVALSRCLTEAYQGRESLARPPTDPALRPLDVYNHTDVFAESLIESVGSPAEVNPFVVPTDNRRLLRGLLERVETAGRRLYVLDMSFLGFPSFYVYVQGLSSLAPVPDSAASPSRLSGEVRHTLLNLEWATRGEIAHAANEQFLELTSSNPLLEVRFAEGFLNAPLWHWMGLRPLLALMLIESGEYEKARTVLLWPPPGREEFGLSFPSPATAPAFRRLLCDYCGLRLEGLSDERILVSLAETYGHTEWAGRLPHLLTRRYGAFVLGGTPEGRFVGLPLPRCLSVYSCYSCGCRRYCRLDEWRRIALRLRSVASPPNPAGLLECLESGRSFGFP